MLVENVLTAATPYLEGRTVKDLVIGLALISCELDNGHVGVSYVLREGLTRGCFQASLYQSLIGQPALKAAEIIMTGTDNIQRAVAASVLTAASQSLAIPTDETNSMFGLDFQPDDTVAMIGYIDPVGEVLSKKVRRWIAFDRGLELEGGYPQISPVEQQAELLPHCDMVLISGTAMINGSIDGLLQMCSAAREIVLLGPSTPMFPEGYQGSRITRLAGSFWANENKPEIFQSIALAGGINSIEKYMRKKLLKL